MSSDSEIVGGGVATAAGANAPESLRLILSHASKIELVVDRNNLLVFAG